MFPVKTANLQICQGLHSSSPSSSSSSHHLSVFSILASLAPLSPCPVTPLHASLGHPAFGPVPSCPWLCLVLLVGCVLVAQCAVSCVGDSGMKISTSCVTPAQPWITSHPADSTCCWPTWSTRTRSSFSAPWRAWRMRTGWYQEKQRN